MLIDLIIHFEPLIQILQIFDSSGSIIENLLQDTPSLILLYLYIKNIKIRIWPMISLFYFQLIFDIFIFTPSNTKDGLYQIFGLIFLFKLILDKIIQNYDHHTRS